MQIEYRQEIASKDLRKTIHMISNIVIGKPNLMTIIVKVKMLDVILGERGWKD